MVWLAHHIFSKPQSNAANDDADMFQTSLRFIQSCGSLLSPFDARPITCAGELFRKLQLFRMSVQSQLMAVRPVFAAEASGTMVVTHAGLEYNYIAHDAALHASLAALYEHIESHPALQDLHDSLKLVNDDAHRLAFDTVVEPLAALLASVPQLAIRRS